MPGRATAQPAQTRAGDPARVSFEQGMAALQANRPADAVRAFTDSYARRPVAIVLYNLALAYQAMGRNVDAVGAFERFLRDPGGVDEARQRAVRREMETLREGLVQVRVVVRPATAATGATVLVDGRVTAPADGAVWFDAGRHALEVRAVGYAAQRREEEFAAGRRLRWEVGLESSAVVAPTVVAPTVVAVAPTVRADDGRDRQRVGMETVIARGDRANVAAEGTRRPGWLVPVVAVASVVAAAGIGVGVWALLRDPRVEVPATTTGWTVETIWVGER